jgi:PAS domain-containing protein
MLGYDREEMLRMNVLDSYLPEERYKAGMRLAGLAELKGRLFERTALRKDRTRIAVEVNVRMRSNGSRQGIVRDITEREATQRRISRLNRVYAVLSGISTLIVRVRDRKELFDGACRIAVEDGGFDIAWIGVLDPRTL